MKAGSVVVGFLDDGHWSACFGLSYLEMCLYDLANSGRIMNERATYLRKVCGTGGIADGRNQVAQSFLDGTEAEWLFFIDTDMGFAKDTVDRLVSSADRYKRPVMGGLCFANRRLGPGELHAEKYGVIPTVYDFVDTGDEVGFSPDPDYARDTVVEAGGTGAACLLINRRALHKVREKYGDAWFDPITHPTGLNGKPRTFSEDLSFCVRLAACDVPLHVNTGVRTCHEKGGVFLDEDLFDRQQLAARRDQAAELAKATTATTAA